MIFSYTKNSSRLKYFIFISISFWGLFAQPAAKQCSQLFSDSLYFSTEFVDKLKSQNFRINAKNQLVDTLNNKAIGDLEIRNSEQLYEWADLKDYQEIWMSNGGLSQQDVNDNIAHANQSYGRGFYVSTNPLDSRSYGPALSIFQTEGLIYTIKNPARIASSDINYIKRLQKAGLDGFSNGSTWLCLISSKHLKIAKKISDPFWIQNKNVLKNVSQNIELIRAIKLSNLESLFDTHTLIGRIIRDQLTEADTKLILDAATQQPQTMYQLTLTSEHSRALAKILEKINQSFYQDFFEKLRTADTNNLDMLFKDSNWISRARTLLNVPDEFKKHVNFNILNLLKYFDLQKIYGALKQKSDDYKSLSDLTQLAQKIVEKFTPTSTKKITSLQDFMKMSSNVLGKRISIRSNRRYLNFNDNSKKIKVMLDYDTQKNIDTHKLLSTTSKSTNYEQIVEYANLKSFSNLSNYISDGLAKKILAALKNKSTEELMQTPYGQKLLQLYLAELAEIFFTHDISKLHNFVKDVFGYYSGNIDNLVILKAFKALRPFESNNDQLEQLYFSYLQQKFPNIEFTQSTVSMPVSEYALFISTSQYVNQTNRHQLISLYLATATDQKDFEYKIEQAYLLLKNYYYLPQTVVIY